MEALITEGTPEYHQQNEKMLMTGQIVIYENDEDMALFKNEIVILNNELGAKDGSVSTRKPFLPTVYLAI